MKETTTYEIMSASVLYFGACAQGAFENETIYGYGFYCKKNRYYIYGHRAEETEKDTRWHRVKTETIHFTVMTRTDVLAESVRKQARRRTEHLADYGSANEMP